MHFNIINWFQFNKRQVKPKWTDLIQLGLLNLKYNKLKQNKPNGNDWGDNEKILIDINEIWVSDISEIDNRMVSASEMDNRTVNTSEMDYRMVNAMRGVVRFIKAHITP